MSRLLVFSLMMLCLSDSGWQDRLQKPYEHLPVQDIGLDSVLVPPDGQEIDTPEAWEDYKTFRVEDFPSDATG